MWKHLGSWWQTNSKRRDTEQEGERVKRLFSVRTWPCPISFICSCLLPPVPQNGSSSKLLALGPWPWERSGDSHKQAASQPAATLVPAVALKSTAGKRLGDCFFFVWLVFSSENSLFFLFPGSTFFIPTSAQPFSESHCISSDSHRVSAAIWSVSPIEIPTP